MQTARPPGPPPRLGSGSDPRRALPSVDLVLREAILLEPIDAYGRGAILTLVRERLEELRHRVVPGTDISAGAIAQAVSHDVGRRFTLSPAPIINATGVIVHTNLGRAPLSDDAIAAITQVATGYSALEYDVERGVRGSRNTLLAPLLSQITGADDGIVATNNAAAVLLVLAAIARGREVIVSRGQAVEIGGGFRIPSILGLSGAKLVEVGTTNRTRLSDYADAINPKTAALLHVHPSNFRITGFTETVAVADLANLAHRHGVPVIDDAGSGCLIDLKQFGISGEPLIQDSVSAGADIICFSGDKLLGGPQSGIVVGGADFIARIRRHPLMRAVRVDKLTLAGLHATLLHYMRGEAIERVPVWQMIAASKDSMRTRASDWHHSISGIPGCRMTLQDGESTIGGGTTPGEALPTVVLSLRPVGTSRGWASRIAAELRQCAHPVLGRVEDGALVLDPRTVIPTQDEFVLAGLLKVLRDAHS